MPCKRSPEKQAQRHSRALRLGFIHDGPIGSTRTRSAKVDELVEDRVDMMRPALRAQVQQSLQDGFNHHSSRSLVDEVAHLRATSARHVGFDVKARLSRRNTAQLKRLRRGSRTATSSRVWRIKTKLRPEASTFVPDVQAIPENDVCQYFSAGPLMERLSEMERSIEILAIRMDSKGSRPSTVEEGMPRITLLQDEIKALQVQTAKEGQVIKSIAARIDPLEQQCKRLDHLDVHSQMTADRVESVDKYCSAGLASLQQVVADEVAVVMDHSKGVIAMLQQLTEKIPVMITAGLQHLVEKFRLEELERKFVENVLGATQNAEPSPSSSSSHLVASVQQLPAGREADPLRGAPSEADAGRDGDPLRGTEPIPELAVPPEAADEEPPPPTLTSHGCGLGYEWDIGSAFDHFVDADGNIRLTDCRGCGARPSRQEREAYLRLWLQIAEDDLNDFRGTDKEDDLTEQVNFFAEALAEFVKDENEEFFDCER